MFCKWVWGPLVSAVFCGIACAPSLELAALGYSDGILRNHYRVFVSSQLYTGALGGLAGADLKCTGLARAAGLVRNYKVILSDQPQGIHASSRIQANANVYVLDAGGVAHLVKDSLATVWSSQSLLYAVKYNEFGNLTAGGVWTGTSGTGAASGSHCTSWSGTGFGLQGASTATNGSWMSNAGAPCATNARIYCISQDD